MRAFALAAVAAVALAGCVATVRPADVEVGVEPVVAVGYYDPAYGYWTGTSWDFAFYDYGHPGWGHRHYYGPRYIHGYRHGYYHRR